MALQLRVCCNETTLYSELKSNVWRIIVSPVLLSYSCYDGQDVSTVATLKMYSTVVLPL